MLKTLKMVKMYLVGNFWSKSFGKKIKRVLNWRCKNGRYKIPISCFLTSKEKKRTFQENGLAFLSHTAGLFFILWPLSELLRDCDTKNLVDVALEEFSRLGEMGQIQQSFRKKLWRNKDQKRLWGGFHFFWKNDPTVQMLPIGLDWSPIGCNPCSLALKAVFFESQLNSIHIRTFRNLEWTHDPLYHLITVITIVLPQ